MKAEGYVADVRTEKWGDGNTKETLTVVLKYGRERDSAFQGLRRVSRPGRRVYVEGSRGIRVPMREVVLAPPHPPEESLLRRALAVRVDRLRLALTVARLS